MRRGRAARWLFLLAAGAGAGGAAAALAQGSSGRTLRVCADPNNLPFSNDREQGFENRLAELVARDLGRRLEYVWWAQRRGFIRNTIAAGECDVVFGIPSRFERVLPTAPYVRSTYVFVTHDTLSPVLTSLDDPRLRTLRIGVHLIGDDYTNTPPAHALARRGIIRNVSGYTIYGDYREPNPPARLVEAVAKGEIDVAVVWGPFGGYFAPKQRAGLRVTPVRPASDGPALPFQFDISAGVRRGNDSLRAELDRVLARRAREIGAILRAYRVPVVEDSASGR
ncbi:MAG TPA: substrate-binding domain-containing protein [Gemmatimonadales bacterium]